MKWWLSVFFLVNGAWIPGKDLSLPGWSPREYASAEECEARKTFAERQCRAYPLEYPAAWVCTYGEPASRIDDVQTAGC